MPEGRRAQPSDPETDWGAVAFGLALGVLAAYQQFKLPPVLPLLLRQFGYGRALAGGFMSIYAVAGLALSVPVGRLLARRGPRGLLAAALVFFLTGNGLGLAAPASSAAMLGSRLLEGLGFAIAAVVGAVVTVSSAAPRHRPVAVALWATWIPVGQVAGTLMAIPVVAGGSWRPLWWASVIATLAVGGWGIRLTAAGTAAMAVPARPGSPAVSIPAAADALRGDSRRLLLLSAALFGLWSGQYISYVTWLPQYLVEAHGLSLAAAARAYLLPSLLVIVFNLVTGALLRAGVGLGRLLAGSIGAQALVWLLVPATRSVAQGAASLVVYGVAAGVTATGLFALPGALLGTQASRGFAAMMAGRNLGVLVGPVLLAHVVAAAGGWRPVPALFGGTCAASLLLVLYLSHRISTLETAKHG